MKKSLIPLAIGMAWEHHMKENTMTMRDYRELSPDPKEYKEMTGDHMNPTTPTTENQPARMGDDAIRAGWEATFSVTNPFNPVSLKAFTKVVRWYESARELSAHGGDGGGVGHGVVWEDDGEPVLKWVWDDKLVSVIYEGNMASLLVTEGKRIAYVGKKLPFATQQPASGDAALGAAFRKLFAKSQDGRVNGYDVVEHADATPATAAHGGSGEAIHREGCHLSHVPNMWASCDCNLPTPPTSASDAEVEAVANDMKEAVAAVVQTGGYINSDDVVSWGRQLRAALTRSPAHVDKEKDT